MNLRRRSTYSKLLVELASGPLSDHDSSYKDIDLEELHRVLTGENKPASRATDRTKLLLVRQYAKFR